MMSEELSSTAADAMVMQLNCEWNLRDIAGYHGCDVATVIKMITEKVKAERQAEKELAK